jgi:hypothetical protein
MPIKLASWFHRKRVHAEVRLSGRPVSSHRVVNPYHAVFIAHDSACCRKVLEYEGQRFLAAAAPSLPVPECSAARCRCRYIHCEDRRSGEDRRESGALSHPNYGSRNRRLSQGRRAED